MGKFPFSVLSPTTGKGVGSLVTGLLFSCIGARWTFRVLAAACLVLLAVYALLNTYVFTEHAAQGPSSQRSVGRQETGWFGLFILLRKG